MAKRRILKTTLIAFTLCVMVMSVSVLHAQEKTTLDQKVQKSEVAVDGMDGMMKEAFNELEDARSKDDIQRYQCVSESVTAMKGLLRLAEENLLSLREAAARGDRSSAEHEVMKIGIASDKFQELRSQAKSCGSPDLAGVIDGRPTIEKIFDGDLPVSEPVAKFKPTEILLERPVVASDYQ